jgi:hypothetical protein
MRLNFFVIKIGAEGKSKKNYPYSDGPKKNNVPDHKRFAIVLNTKNYLDSGQNWLRLCNFKRPGI